MSVWFDRIVKTTSAAAVPDFARNEWRDLWTSASKVKKLKKKKKRKGKAGFHRTTEMPRAVSDVNLRAGCRAGSEAG